MAIRVKQLEKYLRTEEKIRMKRKPILFDKLYRNSNKMNYQHTIGIIGTHHGTGVTHTGIMLAFYLGEKLGKRTALLECNSHHDMDFIQAGYEWIDEKNNAFSFHNITCLKGVLDHRIPEILGDGYEFLILDFGIDLQAHREEYLRCGTKIVVGGQAAWELQRLNGFIEKAGMIKGNENWLYFIPLAGDQLVKGLHSKWKRHFYAVPFQIEPTLSTRQINRFFYDQVKIR